VIQWQVDVVKGEANVKLLWSVDLLYNKSPQQIEVMKFGL